MEHLQSYRLFEAANKEFIGSFLLDFGYLITFGFSQITRMGIDQQSTAELTLMMKRLNQPIVNGQTYSELILDINTLTKNPKLLSAVIGQIRELLIYIEPRVKKYAKDSDIKNNWLEKITKLKERYRTIVQ